MRFCFIAAALLALPFSLAAHATTFNVYDISNANGRGIIGIDAAGDILIDNGFGKFETYNDGKLISSSTALPAFVGDNGGACAVPAGVNSHGRALCNGAVELYTDSGNPDANFNEIFPGSAPLGDLIYFGTNFALPSVGGSRFSAALNSAGDFVYVDARNEDIVEFSVATTPEPSSFLLLGTGALGVAGIMKRRFA